MSETTWKARLATEIPVGWGEEIDAFEDQISRIKAGKLDDKLFMEARLRRGAYGQRYDNGQRHDGQQTRTLAFPNPTIFKGPGTYWEAPGMQRIKIPFGKVSAAQLDVLAECAEEYSDGILHVTTRQDIQLHFVHIDDTPDLMRRLAAVGITTREACGNSVRNITACPLAGVCHEETFDVSPYAHALTFFLLGHPDVQDFGRKFKIAFSGCKHNPCGLTNFHDMGAIAAVRQVDGRVQRGFEYYVGGGLGSVPQAAKLFDEFLPEEELLPITQAVCRVFARLGEKKNRARARIKFLVKNLGIDEFRRLVLEERAKLRIDPRWTAFLADLRVTDETPLRPAGKTPEQGLPEGFEAWARSNVFRQKQAGYATVTVCLPLGDLTSDQTRALADIARQYTGDTLRTTVEQNIVCRWVSEADLPAFYLELQRVGLAQPGAGTISDITSCPGTDTCKLGISASRGLAGELRKRLQVIDGGIDPAVRQLRIKASGCFNACGQHHVADLGFLGVSRNVGGRRVPHFQVVLGGEWRNNGGAFGLALGAIPSKRVPEAVQRITDLYVAGRQDDESFQAFIQRIGKTAIRTAIHDLTEVPSYEQDASFYTDWGDTREYTIGDMGEGECAGEVVPYVQFGLQASEREVFEAQVHLDEGRVAAALQRSFEAMLTAAKALIRHTGNEVSEQADDVVQQFRVHLHDTQLFHDPFAGGKFAHFLLRKAAVGADSSAVGGADEQQRAATASAEAAHQAIEEAQLFLEAAHACYDRMSQSVRVAQDAGAKK